MPDETSQSQNPHALLAGGGSGGHVFPALAVARELEARGWRVSWIGRNEGMERDLVTRAGIEYHGLPARAVTGRGPLGKLAGLGTAAASALRACRLTRRLGTRVVLGTGGYVSVPGVLGGRLAGRPVFLLEPNARAGVANRRLAFLSRSVFMGFDDEGRQFGRRAQVTGVPVRAEFFAIPELKIENDTPRLLVLGGSQGARQINQLMPEVCKRLGERFRELDVLHQAGRGHAEGVRADYERLELGAARIEVVPFLEDVAAAMAGAHLVISRAGALTLAEICAAGRPSILIPLTIAGGHQGLNARHLVSAGAAEMLRGEEASAEALSDLVAKLLSDPRSLESRARAARALSRPDAAERIADVLIGEAV